MIIKVKYENEYFIEYDNVDSFDLSYPGYLWLLLDDGTDVFVNKDKMTWFSTDYPDSE